MLVVPTAGRENLIFEGVCSSCYQSRCREYSVRCGGSSGGVVDVDVDVVIDVVVVIVVCCCWLLELGLFSRV